ncbi:ankyrin repeat-containing domain protein [Hyaloscypha finlandica]|nr:ankyrin repeat-containing domain protein [Hyaloscypha finlandica]
MATPLSEAIRLKRAGIVKLLEEHGALSQIKEATRYRAALVAAFYAGDFGMANRLLELYGPHTPEILGYCLVQAIHLNQIKLVLRLLELGASPNPNKSVNALSLAMRKRESELIRVLLDSPDIDLTALYEIDRRPYPERFSPLFDAVKLGDRSLIMELIMAGAPVNSDTGSITPLMMAVRVNDRELVELLLRFGASVNFSAVYMQNSEITDVLLRKFRESYPRGKAVYGLEAMRIAVRRGDLPLVAKLLANGIGTPLISALAVKQQKTPFAEAIEQGGETGFAIFRMMLDAMIERNTAASLNAIIYRRERDSILENETALLVAVKVQNFDKVQLLVEMGADVNRSTAHGVKRTPLQKAAEVGDFRISEYLINRGANVNAPPAGSGGATALQFACIYGYAGIVDLLLQNGADLDAAPARFEGRTALEGAAEHGRLDTVAILLNTGVKVDGDHRPQFERAIERAQEGGHLAVVDLLVRDSRLRQECEPRDSDKGGSCLVMSEGGLGEEFICWES